MTWCRAWLAIVAEMEAAYDDALPKYMKGITFQYYFGTERAIAKLTKL